MRARAVPNRSPAFAKMGSEAVPSGVLTLAESDIAPQAGAPPLEGYDLGFEPTKEDCLLVIDLQVDFMPGGALEVPGGTEVFPLVNAMIEKFECVVMSQDWHPPAHSSFASQHEGKAPYDVTSMPYGEQTLWPDHCVQGTSGCVTRVGFSQLPERVSRASTTPRASPSPVLPRSRPARHNPARCPSFARATCALDTRSSPLHRRDSVWMSTTTNLRRRLRSPRVVRPASRASSHPSRLTHPPHHSSISDSARFHADLSIPERARVCRKGFRKHVDSYSAFFENDHVTATGLEAYLKSEGVKRVFVVGVAYDFCVRYSCEDAAKAGFESVLVKDATRAVGLPGSVEAADRGVVEAGVRTANSGGLAAVAR